MYWCGCVVMAYVNVPNATVERTKSKEGKGGKKKTNHKHFVLRIWISFLSLKKCCGARLFRWIVSLYNALGLPEPNWVEYKSKSAYIIPKLLPTTLPMLNPNFKSFCTEWCRCPLEFWLTIWEWPWSGWCDCLLLLCCWADLISWFFNFSCSSRSRRAYLICKKELNQPIGLIKKQIRFRWNRTSSCDLATEKSAHFSRISMSNAILRSQSKCLPVH